MSEAASSSSTPKPPSAPAPKDAAVEDIEKLLSREATAFQREMEVERILKAFKLKCVSSSSPASSSYVLTTGAITAALIARTKF